MHSDNTYRKNIHRNSINRVTGAKLLAPSILSGIALCVLTGCGLGEGGSLSTARSDVRTHLYVGIDVSGSVGGRCAASVLLTEDLARALTPGQDALTLYRVDRETAAFYDQAVPAGSEELEQTMVAEVRKVQEMNARSHRYGTYPGRFWAEISRRVAAEQGPVAVVLFSDGENTDASAAGQRAIRQAAQALAASPYVLSVSVYGVNSENFAPIHRGMDALGGRLHLYGTEQKDVQAVVDSFQRAATASANASRQ